MEIVLELFGKFLWDLVKDAVMLFIITQLKAWFGRLFMSHFS